MKTFLTAAAFFGAIIVWAVCSAAFAKGGGKEFYSQDYQFNQPMKGYEGQAGNYYCSYQRLPNRVCSTSSNGNERCRVQGWTLRQYCY